MLRAEGAHIEQHPFGFVVRSPDNPGYHWGNFLLVEQPQPPAECLELFREHVDVEHVSIGMLWEPDPQEWAGFTLGCNEVQVSASPPVAEPVVGYTVRALTAADWERTFEGDVGMRQFQSRHAAARLRLAQAGQGEFFGAFADDRLVARLGIIMCGDGIARYQSVMTDPDHRRRGLASHLLGVAGSWAQARGATQWVIHVDPDTPAQRLYSALGFRTVELAHQAEQP